MSKFSAYAEIREAPYSSWVNIIGYFLIAYVSMLATGALGHRFHNAFLQHVGYWDLWLLRLATAVFRSQSVSRWVVGKPS